MSEALEKPILNEADLLRESEEREPEEESEIYLTMDELLDSLGLEREDVDLFRKK